MRFVLDLISYPRGVLVTLLGLIHTFAMSIIVLCVALINSRRDLQDYLILTWWATPLIFLSGGRVEVRGGENAGGDQKGFLVLFNHSSLMDIPILYKYFPRSFRFGAKIELFKIPFFGKAMELCGVLPIDRRNRNKVMEVYRNAVERVNRGEAFALAPEGTRQAGMTLGKFKRGPFEFAINAQMDIVPVLLAGAYDILPRKALFLGLGKWHHRVILQVLPRVTTAGLDIGQAEELTEKVRAMMDPVYTRLMTELKGPSEPKLLS